MLQIVKFIQLSPHGLVLELPAIQCLFTLYSALLKLLVFLFQDEFFALALEEISSDVLELTFDGLLVIAFPVVHWVDSRGIYASSRLRGRGRGSLGRHSYCFISEVANQRVLFVEVALQQPYFLLQISNDLVLLLCL